MGEETSFDNVETTTFFKDIFYQIVSFTFPQEEWPSHKIMERPYKISKKLASYQNQGPFKDIFQIWPNFKALKMNQFFSRIFNVFQGCGSPECSLG